MIFMRNILTHLDNIAYLNLDISWRIEAWGVQEEIQNTYGLQKTKYEKASMMEWMLTV